MYMPRCTLEAQTCGNFSVMDEYFETMHKHWAILVFPILVLGISGWNVLRQIEFDRHMLRARIAFAQERWSQVLGHANNALRKGVFDEQVLLMRGRAAVEQGHVQEALKDYQSGLGYHPHSVGLWTAQGNVLRLLGDRAGAFTAFRQVLKFDTRSGEAMNNIGMLYVDMGQLDSARVSFEQAVRFEPSLLGAYANLSIALRRKGDMVRALDAAEEGLRYGPDHLELLVAKGNVYMGVEKFDAAAQVFEQAFRIHPQRAELLFSLGQVYEKQGKSEQAVSAYERFLQAWPNKSVPQVDFVIKRLNILLHRNTGG